VKINFSAINLWTENYGLQFVLFPYYGCGNEREIMMYEKGQQHCDAQI
jgi:hypothetical protein